MKVIKNAGHQSWRTPPWLFRKLDAEFHFQVDAAAVRENALCKMWIPPGDDARAGIAWRYYLSKNRRRFFMNPPFNEIQPFLSAALHAAWHGATVVCLLPARVEVAWAHEIIYPYAREVRFIRGRVRYYHSARQGRPNFPSMIVVLGPGVRRGPLRVQTMER